MERTNLNISQNLWWTERDSILIAYYDSSTGKFSSPTIVKQINLLYIQRPDKFLVPGESPERDGFTTATTSAVTGSYLGTELGGTDTTPTMQVTQYLTQDCEIPEQFHEALVNRVIANGYERKVETLPLSKFSDISIAFNTIAFPFNNILLGLFVKGTPTIRVIRAVPTVSTRTAKPAPPVFSKVTPVTPPVYTRVI